MSTSVSHGYLPAGRYIVNHDIMHCTADGVAGNDLYSGRALGLTEPDDYIQLHPVLRPLWKDIASHYHRIGLSHSENVIWDVSLDQLAAYEGYRPSVFYFGPAGVQGLERSGMAGNSRVHQFEKQFHGACGRAGYRCAADAMLSQCR